MWWVIGGVLLLVAMGMYFPTPREREIASKGRVLPRDVTNRDIAFVIEYHRRFGEKEFRLRQLIGRQISKDLMDRFDVKSGPLDDKGILRTRLPGSGLLESRRAGVYQLTENARELALKYSSR